MGSGGAFLVLESREAAQARGADAYARLGPIASARTPRDRDDLASSLRVLYDKLDSAETTLAVMSAASGAHAATTAERAFLDTLEQAPVRAFSTATGHLKEAQFPFAVGLAAMVVHHARLFPPIDPLREGAASVAPEAVLATTVGFHRFEGMALVSAP